jgi:hypothetical protein
MIIIALFFDMMLLILLSEAPYVVAEGVNRNITVSIAASLSGKLRKTNWYLQRLRECIAIYRMVYCDSGLILKYILYEVYCLQRRESPLPPSQSQNFTLKVEAAGSFEMLVRFYQTT